MSRSGMEAALKRNFFLGVMSVNSLVLSGGGILQRLTSSGIELLGTDSRVLLSSSLNGLMVSQRCCQLTLPFLKILAAIRQTRNHDTTNERTGMARTSKQLVGLFGGRPFLVNDLLEHVANRLGLGAGDAPELRDRFAANPSRCKAPISTSKRDCQFQEDQMRTCPRTE